jgi:hypothetical protein
MLSSSGRRAALGLSVVVLAALALIPWLISRPADPLPQTYRNTTYGFSLRLPADYTITEVPNTNPPDENAIADIIEFADAGGSVQLTITDASYAAPELSVQSLSSEYPSIAAVQTQPFPIAPGETGLAFSDDSSRPDQISDVWFGDSGRLYQLTAHGDGFSELMPIAHSVALF